MGKRLLKGLDSTEANLNLPLNGAIIEQVKSHKLPAIHINQDLHFDAQSDALCKSLSKKIGLLKHISPYLKRSHKELYYDAVLKPSFLYVSSVWSSTSKANLDNIFRVQKRAVRVTINAPFNARSMDLFNQRAKKVMSDSLGLVDFAIRLVIFVLNLPDRQVLFFGEIQITEGL